jgi:hypothetical protein
MVGPCHFLGELFSDARFESPCLSVFVSHTRLQIIRVYFSATLETVPSMDPRSGSNACPFTLQVRAFPTRH